MCTIKVGLIALVAALWAFGCGPASHIHSDGAAPDGAHPDGASPDGSPGADAGVDAGDPCTGHCANGQLDCGEIYLDCGGGDCAPCAPVQLAPLTDKGSYPRVAVASWDKVMVVWHRDDLTDSRLRWRCFDGAAWTPTEQVTPGTGFEGYPWLVTDDQGRFHVVHSHDLGNNRATHYNRYDAPDCYGQWHDTAEVVPKDLPYNAPFPSLGLDENDQPHVTQAQAQATKLDPGDAFYECDGTGACPVDYHCYGRTRSYPGNCIADYQQHYSRRTGGAWGAGTWTAPVSLSTGLTGTVAHHGSLFVQSATAAHAVWMQTYPGPEIYYSQYDGATWSPPELTGISAHVADVQADSQTVYVFSETARYTTRPISPTSGAPWSPVVNISTGQTTINLMKLKLDLFGHLHAVWKQQAAILYSRTDGGGVWQPPKQVSSLVDHGHEPSLDVDGDGNVHLVWNECTPLPHANANCSGDDFGSVWYWKTRYEEIP